MRQLVSKSAISQVGRIVPSNEVSAFSNMQLMQREERTMLVSFGISIVVGIITCGILILSSLVFTNVSFNAFQSAILGLSFATAIFYVILSVGWLKCSASVTVLRLGKNILVAVVGGFLFTIATETYYGVNLFTGMDCQPFRQYLAGEGMPVCPHHAFWQGFYFLTTRVLPLWSFVALVVVCVFTFDYARRQRSSQRLQTTLMKPV